MAMRIHSTNSDGKGIVLDAKMGIIILLVLISGAIGWWGWKQHEVASDAQSVVKQKQKELMAKDEKLGKAQTDFGNAQKQLKNLSADWQQWIKEHGGTIQDVAYWQGKYEVAVKDGKGDKIEIAIPNAPVNSTPTNGSSIGSGTNNSNTTTEYTQVSQVDSLGKSIWLDTNNDGKPDVQTSKVVMHYKDYRIAIDVDALQNLFSYTLTQNFHGEFVKVIEPKTGAVAHFLRIWELDDKGNKINSMDIKNFKVITQSPQDKSKYNYWWNPKVDVGVNVGISSRLQAVAAPELGISVATRGKTPDDSDWRFLRLSVVQNKDDYVFNIAPVCWNAAKKLPVVEKMYLCPTIGTTTKSDKVIGIGINTNF